ncbi:hypothetical protein D4764_07G0003890 [Takifugu flavidus]|uniref:TNF family profile domain-containing protein n=1 Tax=Takifugu flavidus TaxID=433684 RepID=A0A5C6MVY4_9TELE|nr:hypothetical protein D4764_07G0003890 [Takifugu flavidus]
MDNGRMDAHRGRAHRGSKRMRKLVLAVLQNLLVITCLLLTFSVYWRNAEKPSSEDIVHIRFSDIGDIANNGTLTFDDIRSSYQMNLTGKNDRIEIRCTGPYVLYMNACYKSLRDHETRGYLQLQVSGQKIPESSITLTATQDDVCTGLLRTVYLRANEQASLYLYVTDGFKVKTLSVGLSYLLGSQCDF